MPKITGKAKAYYNLVKSNPGKSYKEYAQLRGDALNVAGANLSYLHNQRGLLTSDGNTPRHYYPAEDEEIPPEKGEVVDKLAPYYEKLEKAEEEVDQEINKLKKRKARLRKARKDLVKD